MDTRSNIPLIVIVGPTASGKSDFAISIAKKYEGELICADSRTVYKGMDIGTAKPTYVERGDVPHHMLDIVEPGEHFTAARFKELAVKAMTDIHARGHLPILVGGTGLYVDAVIFDYAFGGHADSGRRAELQRMSTDELQDICRYKNIDLPTNPLNKRHLIRAIETGKIKSQIKILRNNTLVVGIATKKDVLRARITKRAERMFNAGVIEEGKRLAEKYGWDNEAMTGNIYPTIHDLLDAKITLEEAVSKFIMSDVHLAKRQLTWFKRNPYIQWGSTKELEQVIDEFIVKQFRSIA